MLPLPVTTMVICLQSHAHVIPLSGDDNPPLLSLAKFLLNPLKTWIDVLQKTISLLPLHIFQLAWNLKGILQLPPITNSVSQSIMVIPFPL